MFLIDTDVLSALRKRKRHPEIAQWVEEQRSADLYLSVVSVGEMNAASCGNSAVTRCMRMNSPPGWTAYLHSTATGFSPSICQRRAVGATCAVSSVMKAPTC